MRPRDAIAEGLRNWYVFDGRMRRGPYLWFLAVSTLTYALAIWAASQVAPSQFGTAVLILTALFYIPVTSAGARRLKDAGFAGHLMLRPLLPALFVTVTACLLFGTTSVGSVFASVGLVIGAMFLPRVLLSLMALLAIATVIATMITFSDTFSKLLLPSQDARRDAA